MKPCIVPIRLPSRTMLFACHRRHIRIEKEGISFPRRGKGDGVRSCGRRSVGAKCRGSEMRVSSWEKRVTRVKREKRTMKLACQGTKITELGMKRIKWLLFPGTRGRWPPPLGRSPWNFWDMPGPWIDRKTSDWNETHGSSRSSRRWTRQKVSRYSLSLMSVRGSVFSSSSSWLGQSLWSALCCSNI